MPVFATEAEELKERIALNAFADEVLEQCVAGPALAQGVDDPLPDRVVAGWGRAGRGVVCSPATSCSTRPRTPPGTSARTTPGRCSPAGPAASTGSGRGRWCARRWTWPARRWASWASSSSTLGCPEAVADGARRTVAEELDAILSTVHTASEKQKLIEQINRALSNRVLRGGPGREGGWRVLYRSVGYQRSPSSGRTRSPEGLFYRMYREGEPEWHSDGKAHPGIEAAIREQGLELLSPERHSLQGVLGIDGAVELVLVSGKTRADWLGKVLVHPSPMGFSTYSLDLVKLTAEMARERLSGPQPRAPAPVAVLSRAGHLSQLLKEPPTPRSTCPPREERLAILYADINGFQAQRAGARAAEAIGGFIDDWGQGARWTSSGSTGGTFDKMVGDCVIGLWGPPVLPDPPRGARAAGAARRQGDARLHGRLSARGT
jgi:hypothetical protein